MTSKEGIKSSTACILAHIPARSCSLKIVPPSTWPRTSLTSLVHNRGAWSSMAFMVTSSIYCITLGRGMPNWMRFVVGWCSVASVGAIFSKDLPCNLNHAAGPSSTSPFVNIWTHYSTVVRRRYNFLIGSRQRVQTLWVQASNDRYVSIKGWYRIAFPSWFPKFC